MSADIRLAPFALADALHRVLKVTPGGRGARGNTSHPKMRGTPAVCTAKLQRCIPARTYHPAGPCQSNPAPLDCAERGKLQFIRETAGENHASASVKRPRSEGVWRGFSCSRRAC